MADPVDLEFQARMELAQSIAISKEGKTLTQTEIGKRAGELLGKEISKKNVSRYFNGRVPDLKTILALALAMRVPPGWLAFGEKAWGDAPPPADAGAWSARPRKD